MQLVLMFPGQSSRYAGMLDKLVQLHERNGELLARSSELLGRDLEKHYAEDNADAFACNKDIQIGVFLANQMFLQLLDAEQLAAQASLGLSLGEWNHLVHIGALDFDTALLAVEQRGAAYDDGPAGAMASVYPIDLDELIEVAERVRDHGVLEVVNRNSPGQQVLSGEMPALEAALQILEDDFYVEATIIERKVPMHCSIFKPVGLRFREHLSGLTFNKPKLPYLPNRLAELMYSPTQEDFVDMLSSHVYRPVLWRNSIDLVLATWPEAVLVEVGPRRVLYNLIGRKWHRNVTKLHMDAGDDFAEHVRGVIERLQAIASEGAS